MTAGKQFLSTEDFNLKKEIDLSGLCPLHAFCRMVNDMDDGGHIDINGAFAVLLAEDIESMIAHNIELMEANRVLKDELECGDVDDGGYDK